MPELSAGCGKALWLRTDKVEADTMLVKPITRPIAAICPTEDALTRRVFGLLGMTIDAINFQALLRYVNVASERRTPCFISTPNVNFLAISRRNFAFRESLLCSDLCIADGMPLIWISKLLRIPIHERVTGADLFDTLKQNREGRRRLRVFLFGGAEGVAATVAKNLNESSPGLECVGSLYPGFGAVDDMSTREIIETINSSGADLLAVFLGAEKAQTWLLNNHDRIKVPIRAQFGAAINFEAGTIRRAPPLLRSSGFEWLWRIKEEPYLWRRYWKDGLTLLRLMLTSVIPLAVYYELTRLKSEKSQQGLVVDSKEDDRAVVITLCGLATEKHVNAAIDSFRLALESGKDIVIRCAKLGAMDARFLGLLLMVRKQLMSRGQSLLFAEMPGTIQRMVRMNGFNFLLAHAAGSTEKIDRMVHPGSG